MGMAADRTQPVRWDTMSRRIDIELTSARPDGSWTWRAAGAREPRGVLDGSLLPAGSKAGNVVKAEAEFELDGITILSVVNGREKAVKSGLLELKPSERPFEAVTSQLAQRGRGERREGREGRGRRGDPGGRPPVDGRAAPPPPARRRVARPRRRGEGRPRRAGPARSAQRRRCRRRPGRGARRVHADARGRAEGSARRQAGEG